MSTWLRRLTTAIGVLGLLITLVGAAGLPDDVVTWKGWLEDPVNWLSGDAGRWLLVAVGVAIAVVAFGINLTATRGESSPKNPTSRPATAGEELAGVWWFWNGSRYRDFAWFGKRIVEPYCLTHRSAKLLLEAHRTGARTTIRSLKRSEYVATESHRAGDYLYCPKGHQVLLASEDGRLEQVRIRAEGLIDAKMREGDTA